MPDPLLPRGALRRLGIVALIAAFFLAPQFARAGDGARWNCRPLAEVEARVAARGGSAFVRLSDAQWQFLRGMYAALPDTPESLPAGDRALISRLPDGTAVVSFADGDQSCVVVKITESVVALLMSVGEGEIVHAGAPL